MLGIVQALGSFGAWAAGLVAARWGYKVALIAAVLAVYAAVWAAMIAALAALIALIPAPPFVAFVLQFFPSPGAVSVAVSAYFGTMATLRSLEYWRIVSGLAARIGS
jgi:hypothetical protein